MAENQRSLATYVGSEFVETPSAKFSVKLSVGNDKKDIQERCDDPVQTQLDDIDEDEL